MEDLEHLETGPPNPLSQRILMLMESRIEQQQSALDEQRKVLERERGLWDAEVAAIRVEQARVEREQQDALRKEHGIPSYAPVVIDEHGQVVNSTRNSHSHSLAEQNEDSQPVVPKPLKPAGYFEYAPDGTKTWREIKR